jgi:hypothetical protein
MDDTQNRFGSLHSAYLSFLSIESHVPDFALCPAFRCSLVGRDSHDYYSGSVIMGLAGL